MSLGKKLYHSTAITSVKVVAVMMIGVLFMNLIYQTIGQDHFQLYLDRLALTNHDITFGLIMSYHGQYPEELILYFLTIFFPAIYYGFIRGVTFYEKGLKVNRGLPYFFTKISYDQIESFQIVHRRHLMSIIIKETKDEMLFSVRNMDRVLAIFDQNGISGKLQNDDTKSTNAPLKLVMFFFIIAMAIAFVQYSAVIRNLFR